MTELLSLFLLGDFETWRSPAPKSSDEPISPDRLRQLRELEKQIGYRFSNLRLLDLAFTHKSYSHELTGDARRLSYEALEFLGDSILGFVISDHLFHQFPDLSEGELSKIKSFLVSTRQLHSLSLKLGLGEFLQLSRGEVKTGGRNKKAILADLFESTVAAIYLDGGGEEARSFILSQFRERLAQLSENVLELQDYKSSLQERIHEMGRSAPQYRVVAEMGPDHEKEFSIEVYMDGQRLGGGIGRSKKDAEQRAARQALHYLADASRIEGDAGEK